MPALNVDFSDEEMAALRAEAHERGITLKALLKQSATAEISHQRALREGAQVFREFISAHQAEFDQAFPDEVPGSGRHPSGSAA
ncbi:hypothetical protein BIV57_12785 [Mangrovactinospora gilvigrisea]|uniref:Uncharacterized protein n=1 Tax=Mangrovactinospora gilvigrisea TaxID=1428644 RepID=A0A1J7BEV8_9ACTN|nr:hypothetical protein [Mangrovactinospora gilvigrisea]OIV37109.1 hypothetical protein BIV57_12785 [Mangrovactinospora gilvigrisea]